MASIVLAVVAVTGIATSNVNAQTAQEPLCELAPVQIGKMIAINGNTATSRFSLKGAANCKYYMSLFSFEAPSANGQPFREQTLYAQQTKFVGPGNHTLTVEIPECYFQVDMVTGRPLDAKKGDRLHDVVAETNMPNHGMSGIMVSSHIVDAFVGGNKSCEEPEEEPCPYDENMKKDDPNCFEPCPYDKSMPIDDKDCVKPEEPTDPVAPIEPKEETPKTLPKTGPAAAVFGIGSIAAAVRQLIMSRRGLIKTSLLNR